MFRHALSLDEVPSHKRGICVSLTWNSQRRARFQPNLFHHETPEEAAKPEDDPELASPATAAPPEHLPAVQEVWFAGCHSDVGGGAVEDTVRYSLGDVSLRWMIKQVVLSKCGIRFDAAALERADIDVSTTALACPTQQTVDQLWKWKSEAVPAPSTLLAPSEEDGSEEDLIPKGKGKDDVAEVWPQEDIMADTHDKLKSQPWWWILELVLMKFAWQEADGTWKSKLGYPVTSLSIQRTLADLCGNPFSELTLAKVERSGANTPVFTKVCGRG